MRPFSLNPRIGQKDGALGSMNMKVDVYKRSLSIGRALIGEVHGISGQHNDAGPRGK
jgi:hypothetical protein